MGSMREGKSTARANRGLELQLPQKATKPAEEKDRDDRSWRQEFAGDGVTGIFLPRHWRPTP
jgi:hypothetical protein